MPWQHNAWFGSGGAGVFACPPLDVVNCPVMKRRDFLHAGALGFPLAPQALAQTAPRYSGKPALKITDIQSFLVGIESRNLCFVKVLTDQGITGWGEAYSVGPDEATVATKMNAQVQAQATRKARHTMGKREKEKITAADAATAPGATPTNGSGLPH